jgi:hypothetical protein
VELAHQLCRPHGPYSKSQVARALGIAGGTLYFKGKQAGKDKAVADRSKVRGCFALRKRTRHILALAFDYHMRADLVISTIEMIAFSVPGMIWQSDQGSQYGAEQTCNALLRKGA